MTRLPLDVPFADQVREKIARDKTAEWLLRVGATPTLGDAHELLDLVDRLEALPIPEEMR